MATLQLCACGCGTWVGDAHKCPTCNKNVLIHHGQPKEGTDEGYGQPIFCNRCLGINDSGAAGEDTRQDIYVDGPTASGNGGNISRAGDATVAVGGDGVGSPTAEDDAGSSSTSTGGIEVMDVDAPVLGTPTSTSGAARASHAIGSSESTGPTTRWATAYPKYLETENCEDGDGYEIPELIDSALRLDPAPSHPELKHTRLNAFEAYARKEAIEKRRADKRREEEAKRIEAERVQAEQDRIEEEQRSAEEKDYPSKKLVLWDPNSSDRYKNFHLKGTFVGTGIGLDPTVGPMRVEAYAIFWSDARAESQRALLIFRRLANGTSNSAQTDSFSSVICDRSVLPPETAYELHSIRKQVINRRYHVVEVPSFNEVEVPGEGGSPPNYRISTTSPIFGGMTVCKDMMETLKSGTICKKATKDDNAGTGRREFCALPFAFYNGTGNHLVSTHVLTMKEGQMYLSESSEEDQTAMIEAAKMAKSCLFCSPRSKQAILQYVRTAGRHSTPPQYYNFLNVALGGEGTFAPFGKIIKIST